MWTARHQTLASQTTQTGINDHSGELSFGAVIDLWSGSPQFRDYFTALLCGSPFEAFFWETQAVTEQTLQRPFQFVLVEGPALIRLLPDPSPFRSHFAAYPAEPVLRFPNLGGDAILVVPAPQADHGCYPHLSKFLRTAPRPQVDAFWRTVGLAMQERLSSQPVWLSTAGMGVSWLHLRLDSRPKYYRHKPYTRA